MGSRGPVPIPHARRRNKRLTTGKTIAVAHPALPKALTKEAKYEWKRIVPELETMGLLATIDRAVLIRYCRAWQDWCDLDEDLKATGMLVAGRIERTLVRNPLWLMRRDAEATLIDLGKQLGLTPQARLRAGVKHEQPDKEVSVAPAAIADYRKRLKA